MKTSTIAASERNTPQARGGAMDSDFKLTDALRSCMPFQSLDAEGLRRIAATTRLHTFSRGDVVAGMGSASNGLLLILKGRVKLTLDSSHGAEHVLDVLEAGQSLGLAELVSKRPYRFQVTALTPLELLVVPRATVLSEVEHHPLVARQLLKYACEALYRHTGDIETVLGRKASSRVARFLIDLFERETPEPGRSLRLPMKKALIASHLHMTKEHFSRTLKELSDHGAIRVHGPMVLLVSEQELRALAA
ncbi:MAG TPA: Crp/Fnr family transcriptional regulator [Usitatibacteraceae bacterium]|nr:Crp/Fnr family transcriptional regulator [Usitatibacteraceae bacterium]